MLASTLYERGPVDKGSAVTTLDGIIASLALDTKDLSHFMQCEERGIPVIFFDRVEEAANNTNVIINNYKKDFIKLDKNK